jgi:hypothetical protein
VRETSAKSRTKFGIKPRKARAQFKRNIKEADAGFDQLFEEPEYADGRMFIAHGVELINSLINAGEFDKAQYIEWFMARTLARRSRRNRRARGRVENLKI